MTGECAARDIRGINLPNPQSMRGCRGIVYVCATCAPPPFTRR